MTFLLFYSDMRYSDITLEPSRIESRRELLVESLQILELRFTFAGTQIWISLQEIQHTITIQLSKHYSCMATVFHSPIMHDF